MKLQLRGSAQPAPSILDGETLPDFIDPFVKCVEACVKASVVKVEYVSHDQKSENPVVSFHVDQHLLDHVTDGDNNFPQDVHRVPHFREIDIVILEDCSRWAGCWPSIRSVGMLAKSGVKSGYRVQIKSLLNFYDV